jgi:hypothetical protein
METTFTGEYLRRWEDDYDKKVENIEVSYITIDRVKWVHMDGHGKIKL